MPEGTRQAYLEAMDIDSWRLREPVAPQAGGEKITARLKLGAGNSGILLICRVDSDSAGRLANDINRALGSTPVWAWPDEDQATVNINQAVDENLFTTVAVFGNELAGQLFKGELPAHLNSAKLVVLPSMQEIASRAESRRDLWSVICSNGMLV